MAEEVEFQGTWLYRPDYPEGVLIETQDEYDKAMQAGGWVDTPALFGVITAPNREQMVLQALSARPAASPAQVPEPPRGPAFVALEQRVEEQDSEIEAIHALLKKMQDQLSTLVAAQPKGPDAQGKK